MGVIQEADKEGVMEVEVFGVCFQVEETKYSAFFHWRCAFQDCVGFRGYFLGVYSLFLLSLLWLSLLTLVCMYYVSIFVFSFSFFLGCGNIQGSGFWPWFWEGRWLHGGFHGEEIAFHHNVSFEFQDLLERLVENWKRREANLVTSEPLLGKFLS